jgi:hypothetical protein
LYPFFAIAVSRVKACRIDLESIYPCPCRKRGQLHPIALTEAFGCNQCQHIFVVRADGYVLEQLSSIYPYKQLWYWTGQGWVPVRTPMYQSSYAWIVGGLTAFFLLLLLCLPVMFRIPLDHRVMVWMFLMILIVVPVLSFMVWLTMYRQP